MKKQPLICLAILSLIAALLAGAIGWWANTSVEQAMKEVLSKKLNAIIETDVVALATWIESQKKAVTSIASEPRLRRLVSQLTIFVNNNNENVVEISHSHELRELREYLTPRLMLMGYQGFSVLDLHGVIIGASHDYFQGGSIHANHTGQFNLLVSEQQKAVLTTPFRCQLKGHSPQENSPIMVAASTVRNEENQVFAILGLNIRPEDDFTRILQAGRPGKSGETYAFDRSGLMISESRFDRQLKEIGLLSSHKETRSILNIDIRDPGGDLTKGYATNGILSGQPLTKMATNAISGINGLDVDGYRDYRGVPVVGTWRWLEEYNFGVTTELDMDEAYKPLLLLRRIFIVLFTGLVLFAVGLLLFSFVWLKLRRRVHEVELEAKRLGQYTLTKKIGEGGMGVVYEAKHALLQRPTAIKLLLPDKAKEKSILKFEREVQLTSQLTHPNTIQIYDFGRTSDGIFYYAMEYINGINLKQMVTAFGGQPPGRVIHVIKQICASLSEAHLSGLIHRDIKPANIIVSNRGGMVDVVKVLDFGIVKASKTAEKNAQLTDEDMLSGTPSYISPESISEPDKVDCRSDIYSVGATSYYLLTGKDVFEGKTATNIYRKHLTEIPLRPSARMKQSYPRDLEEIIMKCLEKNPENRFSDTRQLNDQLGLCVDNKSWTESCAHAWWSDNADRIVAESQDIDEGSSLKTIPINIRERKDAESNG